MEKNEVIKYLIDKKSNQVNGLTIKNVTVTKKDDYTQVALTLKEEVEGYISKDKGVTYEKGKTNIIFTSTFALAAILKDDDDAAFAANKLIENPDMLTVILSRAKINIIQEPVMAKEAYVNPWSSDDEATVFGHDTIINHIVELKLTDKVVAKLDRLADAILGI